MKNFKKAKAFLLELSAKIGMGFHPNDSISSYVTADGKPLFSANESKKLEAKLTRAINLFDAHSVDYYEFLLTNLPTSTMQRSAILMEGKSDAITLEGISAKFNAINKAYIDQLHSVLVELSECKEIVNANAISWISNDLDYIAVNYYMQEADGDYQNECKLGHQISDADAIQILTTRINNTI
jgi:hypothetical protein